MSQPTNGQSTSKKLTDTQLVVLSRAAQHETGAAILPEKINGKAAQKLAISLIERKLVRKVKASDGKPVWRQEETGAIALIITKLGRAAINVSEEVDESGAKDAGDPEMPATATHIEAPHRAPRDGSKLSNVIALLSNEPGVSIDDLVASTGWLPHTTRAALTGLRKRGYSVERSRPDHGGPSLYRIVGTASRTLAA